MLKLINRWTVLAAITLVTLLGIGHRLSTLPAHAAGLTVSSTSLDVAH